MKRQRCLSLCTVAFLLTVGACSSVVDNEATTTAAASTGPGTSLVGSPVDDPEDTEPAAEDSVKIVDLDHTSLRTATSAALSPDGSRLFWSDGDEVCVGDLNTDGSTPNCTALDMTVDAAVWDPASSAVALSETGWSGIGVFQPDSGEADNIMEEDCWFSEGCPWRIAGSWSPDGRSVAMVTSSPEAVFVETVPIDGGQSSLIALPDGITPGPLHWGRATGSIYLSMATLEEDGLLWGLWQVSGNQPDRPRLVPLRHESRTALLEESQDGRLGLIWLTEFARKPGASPFEVADLLTGEGVRLEIPESGSAIYTATFSPDGSTVAFVWRRSVESSGADEDVLSVATFDAAVGGFGSRTDLLTTGDIPEPESGPLSFGRLSFSPPPWLVWRPDDSFVIPAGASRFVILDASKTLP